MSPAFNRDLNRFARRITAWRLELLAMWGLSALFLTATVAGFVDFVMRTGHLGRWTGFLLLVGICVGTAMLATRLMRRRLTVESLCAFIEHAYPELDNHLINYVQFSRTNTPDPLKEAYVKSEKPTLNSLEINRMKDRRKHRQGATALSASALLLIAPFFVLGNHWTTALLRMINPIVSIAPVTLTHILEVQPGTTDMRQGETMILTVRVQGMRGHTVRVDYTPADGRHTVYEIGRISGNEPQGFSHRVPQVNTRFRYRFRAGDAIPSDWNVVTPRPPPALTQLNAQMTPPAYTKLPAQTLDLTSDTPPRIPAGSTLTIQAACSVPLESLAVSISGAESAQMQFNPAQNSWAFSTSIEKTGFIRLEGIDEYNQTLQEILPYVLVSDQPPVIEILQPQGQVVLPPGEAPVIEFRVHDDYGLSRVYLERVEAGKAAEQDGQCLQEWDATESLSLDQIWRGAAATRQAIAIYRIVAVDNTKEIPQVTRSQPILFNTPPAERLAENRDHLEAQAMAGLQQLIDLQKENIEHCNMLRQAENSGETGLWKEPEERQQKIRELTRGLLTNPVRPLGGRTEAVNRLYANEMILAIEAISRTSTAVSNQRGETASESVTLQSSILRGLQAAQGAAEKAQIDRRQSGISAMLSAMIISQSEILDQIKSAGFAMFASLSEKQDDISEDMAAFEASCKREAIGVRGNDPAFADLLESLAKEARERRIREDMLMTAEWLEQKALAAAIPTGSRAHENLVHIQNLLEKVELQKQQGEKDAMVEALAQAQQKMSRLEEMHASIQESIDSIRGHVDKDDKLFDVFMEEYMELLKKNKESLLTIPTDLHIFTELNVGNELVEDVFSVFEEIEQKAGSENQTVDDLITLAYAKNLEALDFMREAKDRLDEAEKWLTSEPEMFEVVTEALDREEMPEQGAALGQLAAEVQDLIGDLLKESQEIAEAAEDSATNHSADDSGWDVTEGDITGWNAQGKSGNQMPDHKEQDGRSNVGRQGMSSGETAAGSGTISEGDENIEERRTEDPAQSGMVQLEGEADTKATGGGKLGSGKADDVGMDGGAKRMDSTEEGSDEGMAALMSRTADAILAQASTRNVRVDSLKTATQHLRQADDAVAKGNIDRVAEHRKMALAALRRAQVELAAPPSGAIQVGATPSIIQDAVQSGPDLAPPKFQEQVAEYYKLLNEEF